MKRTPHNAGWLLADLIVAMAVIMVALLPLGYTFLAEARLCRAAYYRAVALEVVDGEMEFLAAGEYKAFPPGNHPYLPNSAAAQQLPGSLRLTVTSRLVRLEWRPAARRQGSPVIREFKIP